MIIKLNITCIEYLAKIVQLCENRSSCYFELTHYLNNRRKQINVLKKLVNCGFIKMKETNNTKTLIVYLLPAGRSMNDKMNELSKEGIDVLEFNYYTIK